MAKDINKLSYIISDLLQSELPGERSHLKMIPSVRRSFKKNIKDKSAAVMILLFQENSEIKITFIKRTEYEGVHSGQISFPGGMKESSDRGLLHTSIRETSEETGIDGEDINILGEISPLFIPVSNFEVKPFVGYLKHTPEFHPDPVEVDHMIIIPLRHFLKKENLKKEKWNLSGEGVWVPFYSFKNYRIWGATAMILSEFLDIIEELEPDL